MLRKHLILVERTAFPSPALLKIAHLARLAAVNKLLMPAQPRIDSISSQ